MLSHFTGEQDLLMAKVIMWLQESQPDALQNSETRHRLF
ncbi:phage tail protein [Pantoea sp. Lij88]|nr:phage tail protein [Pantoea sp. Lij88]WHQ73043.1 phage tail protein [Pantoea sp. Lij88]